MTEAELIERAARGERRAVRELYERHAERVLRIVRRISGDPELARDYAQEAWMRVVVGLPAFRGDARFTTWLYRIAVNVALEGVRRTRPRARLEVALPDTLAEPDPGADVLLERRLEEGLARLPEGMREVLVLHDVEGFTHEEVGELLGVSEGTSKSQLFRARAKMRSILSERRPAERQEGVRT